ncbi:Aspartic peptidase domain [Trinorchestia longiramus]|nr:Aspartic peptidase domain [Trinorchestia longiramus]
MRTFITVEYIFLSASVEEMLENTLNSSVMAGATDEPAADLDAAGRMLERHIAYDSSFPTLVDKLQIIPKGGVTVSGLAESDYPGGSASSGTGAVLRHLHTMRKVPLPKELLHHFQHSSESCLTLLPEPLFSVANDGVFLMTVKGTDNGRLFMGAKSGHLWELLYQPTGKLTATVEGRDTTVDSSFPTHANTNLLMKTNPVSEPGCYFLSVKINGILMDALIDNGAVVSVISENLLDKIKPKPTLKNASKTTLIGFGGARVNVIGEVTVTVEEEELCALAFTLLVVPSRTTSQSLVLGLDFLEKYFMMIDTVHRELHYSPPNEKPCILKLKTKPGIEIQSLVRTANEIVIGPNQRILISGKLSDNSICDGTEGCIEPSCVVSGDVLDVEVAYSVGAVRNGHLTVELMNMNPYEVLLKPKTKLGVFVAAHFDVNAVAESSVSIVGGAKDPAVAVNEQVAPKFDGPFVVIEADPNGITYKIARSNGKEVHNVHFNQLKEWYGDDDAREIKVPLQSGQRGCTAAARNTRRPVADLPRASTVDPGTDGINEPLVAPMIGGVPISLSRLADKIAASVYLEKADVFDDAKGEEGRDESSIDEDELPSMEWDHLSDEPEVLEQQRTRKDYSVELRESTAGSASRTELRRDSAP